MTHAPETGARKLASVSGASVMRSGAEFFWHQILESNRTVFYFVTESGDHVIKILSCDWSSVQYYCCFLFNLEILVSWCYLADNNAVKFKNGIVKMTYSEQNSKFFCNLDIQSRPV